jgi:flagellar basal-body rod protein FlgF
MDRMIYTAMNGAARINELQAVVTNNMANANTTGFREQVAMYRSVPMLDGSGLPTRVSTVASTPGNSFAVGPMQSTGRALDVAIGGSGWFAFDTPDGEAYSRAGGLQVGANNALVNVAGQPVLSEENAPIDVPAGAALTIASDGTVSALGAGDAPNALLNLGRLKIVNPLETDLIHGDDGLFRMAGGQAAPLAEPDASRSVMSGTLEGSNANPMGSMVAMIENARRYEMQMQVIKNADTNEQRANGILSTAG